MHSKTIVGMAVLSLLVTAFSLLLYQRHRAAVVARENARSVSVTRTGRTISLNPTRVRFDIPPSWLEWHDRFHNNLHLTSQELQSVENAKGEWDTEYAAVVNSAVPFNKCVAHVGGDGWGAESSSFADTQLRVYVAPQTVSELVSAIANNGLATARNIAPKTATYEDDGNGDGWRNVNLSYFLWYGDYGGTAHVRFYLRPISNQSLVMVFMGGDLQEVDEILKSVIVD